jgi:hypothetical protein
MGSKVRKKIIVQASGSIVGVKGANIASATTTNLYASGDYAHITGSTTITSFGTAPAGYEKTVVFDGSLLLTYNATSLILPGAANIQTGAGDTAIFRSEGSGNWRAITYMTASDSYTNYTPTFTGFGTSPTIVAGDARWKMISRNTCHVIFYPTAQGVSNATTFTMTLPFNSANAGAAGQTYLVVGANNSSSVMCTIRTRINSNIMDCYNGAFGTFTASGNKSVQFSIVYQIEI